MKKIYFICDESGAKGYSDNRESVIGEVGVFAGFAVSEEHFETVRFDLDQIINQYSSITEEKIHITDLTPESQESLREKVFAYFKENSVSCTYMAIHTEGFYEHFNFRDQLIEEAKKHRRSKIKISKNKKKELLHEHLFGGIFGKAVSLCMDNIGKEFHLAIITDQIDESIKKRFEATANKFLSFGDREKIRTVTGFDPDKKEVVTGQIISKIEDPHNLLGDFSGVEFSIECQNSGLTLAADVLANSLVYHFKNRDENCIGNSLNTKEAIIGHPLESIIFGLWEKDDLNFYSDALFMHPENKTKHLTPC